MSSEPLPLRRQQNATPTEALPETPGKPAPDLLLEGEVVWDKYKFPIIIVFVLVIVGLIGSEIYSRNRIAGLAEASTQLDAAKTIDDYKKVIADHDGTLAAAGAYMLMGRAQMTAKDYAGAAETWKTFADKFPQNPLAPNALMGAAGASESNNKFDEARSLYQRIETGYASSYLASLASLAEAGLLKSQGKIEDARHKYENIIAAAPQSDAARQATQSLRLLKAVPSLPADAAPQPSPAAAVVSPAPATTTSPAVAVPAIVIPEPSATPNPSSALLPAVAPTPAAVVPAAPTPTPAPAADARPIDAPVMPTAVPAIPAIPSPAASVAPVPSATPVPTPVASVAPAPSVVPTP